MRQLFLCHIYPILWMGKRKNNFSREHIHAWISAREFLGFNNNDIARKIIWHDRVGRPSLSSSREMFTPRRPFSPLMYDLV